MPSMCCASACLLLGSSRRLLGMPSVHVLQPTDGRRLAAAVRGVRVPGEWRRAVHRHPHRGRRELRSEPRTGRGLHGVLDVLGLHPRERVESVPLRGLRERSPLCSYRDISLRSRKSRESVSTWNNHSGTRAWGAGRGRHQSLVW